MPKNLGIVLPIALGPNGYFRNTDDPTVQIRANLINLLLTKKGERSFRPSFGCDMPRALFEADTESNKAEIHAIIDTAVSAWMPYIRIDEVKTVKDSSKEQGIVVFIKYTVLTTNTTDSLQLVF